MTNQPNWKLIAQLGDANPIAYGGYFVFEDTTGVYAPEAEYLTEPIYDGGQRNVYRFSLDKCTYINGVLSDNKFHPECSAWFAKPESKRAERPQDTTYLSNVANASGMSVEELIQGLCSDNIVERALAYREIGHYHGFDNFDQYPLTLDDEATEQRYSQEKYKLTRG